MSLLLYDSPNLVTILTLWQDDVLKKSEQGVFCPATQKFKTPLKIRLESKITGCFEPNSFSVYNKPSLPFLVGVDHKGKLGTSRLGYFQVYRAFRVGHQLSDLFNRGFASFLTLLP
jgi:hypothetical protein